MKKHKHKRKRKIEVDVVEEFPIFLKPRRIPKTAQELGIQDKIYTTFRPQNDVRKDYVAIVAWCEDNNCSMSSVLNSYVAAIAYTLNNFSFVDPQTNRIYLRSNFGDVLLREPHLRDHKVS